MKYSHAKYFQNIHIVLYYTYTVHIVHTLMQILRHYFFSIFPINKYYSFLIHRNGDVYMHTYINKYIHMYIPGYILQLQLQQKTTLSHI